MLAALTVWPRFVGAPLDGEWIALLEKAKAHTNTKYCFAYYTVVLCCSDWNESTEEVLGFHAAFFKHHY